MNKVTPGSNMLWEGSRMILPEKPKDWKTTHVEWLKEQGYTDTVRDPDQPVTWAELGVVLKRYAEK